MSATDVLEDFAASVLRDRGPEAIVTTAETARTIMADVGDFDDCGPDEDPDDIAAAWAAASTASSRAISGHFPDVPRPADSWPPQGPTLIRKLGPNEGTSLGTNRRSETADAILGLLRARPGMTAKQLDAAIGKPSTNTLYSMLRTGAVRREGTVHQYVWFAGAP